MTSTSGTPGGARPRDARPAAASAGSTADAPTQAIPVKGSEKVAERPAATTASTGTTAPAPKPARTGGRRVKLTLSRVDPFSVLKISFLLSVALGIAGVVAVSVLWGMLNMMGVFSTITESVNELQSGAANSSRIDISDWFSFGRVISVAVILGFIDVVLLTAMATITSIIYNICASLLGGVMVTLSDD